MREDRYAFARAAILCKDSEDPTLPEALARDAYYRCMCDAGITSYCSRVGGGSTEGPAGDGQTTESRWTLAKSFRDTVSVIENDARSDVELTLGFDSGTKLAPETTSSLDTMVTWIGVFSIFLCVTYLVFRCSRQGGCPDEAGPEARAPMLRQGAR